MTKNESEIKISKTNTIYSIVICLFFAVLISIGLTFSKDLNLLNITIFVSFIIFFLFLALRKLNLWSISKKNGTIIFKRILSSKNYEINIAKDLIKIDCDVYEDYDSCIYHYALILRTSSMNFKLSSEDYKNFDELLLEMFKENKSYLNDFKTLKKNKTKKVKYREKYRDKIVFIICIVVFIIYMIFS